VNNAAFATFFETGRVELLFDPGAPWFLDGGTFVIARLVVDFRAELTWPGEVTIGTRVARVGRSSIGLEQGLFQRDVCAATAESVVVHVDAATGRPRALSSAAIARIRDPA
jgi:acyl-CoA thioester hydrolase